MTRETQASRNTRHDDGDEMVEVTVCRCRELQGPEANIVKGFVVDTEGFVRVFDKLVNGKGGVVGLQECYQKNILGGEVV